LLIAGIVKENDPSGFDKMKELVDTVSRKISEDQVSCRSEVLYCEDVARQVLAVSEVEKPDLIVITATLDSSLKDFFLGPYTQDIVNHARFPVLSIRQQASGENIQMQPLRQREV
jgi:nucleotide-binding universal stress UspA family protein